MEKKQINGADLAKLMVGIWCYTRGAELAALTKSSFIFSDAQITVKFIRLKTPVENNQMNIKIVDLKCFKFSTLEVIKQYVQSLATNDTLFMNNGTGKNMTTNQISKWLQAIMKRASISGSFTSHAIRHSGASFAAARRVPEAMIRAIACWKSDSIWFYIHDVPTIYPWSVMNSILEYWDGQVRLSIFE